MEDYNQQDAKSVLEYIYRNYGKTVFQEKGKARAYFNDLAPQLSKDRNMLKVLDEIGVLQDLCSVNSDDRDRQKKAELKTATKELAKAENKKAAAEAKATEEAKKGEAEDVLKKLLASGMTAEEILAKLQ